MSFRRGLSDDEIRDLLLELETDESGAEDLSDYPEEHSDSDSDYIEENGDLSDETDSCDSDSESESDLDEGDFTSTSGMKWSAEIPANTRRLASSIVTTMPGLTGTSKNIFSESESFQLFISPDIVNIILLLTNEEGIRITEKQNSNHKNADKQFVFEPVSVLEINAGIGLLLALGVLRMRKTSTDKLWSIDEAYQSPLFVAIMSRDRFRLFLKLCRFDDRNTRSTRKTNDKLAPIQEVTDKLSVNYRISFTPYEYMTVDEQLVSFRGKCLFRVYMKSKPCKYGLKIWVAADAKVPYTYNFQVYTGKIYLKLDRNKEL